MISANNAKIEKKVTDAIKEKECSLLWVRKYLETSYIQWVEELTGL
jgi:hypothetical protein